jgi:hypothetical protein
MPFPSLEGDLSPGFGRGSYFECGKMHRGADLAAHHADCQAAAGYDAC